MSDNRTTSSRRGPQVVQPAHSDPNDPNLNCGICYAFYVTPKKLPCNHIFCAACLVGRQIKSKERKEVRCPTCRRSYSMEVSRLPTFGELGRRANQARESVRTSPTVCQELECSNRAANEPVVCPHCSRRLCIIHLNQHIDEIKRMHCSLMNELNRKQYALSGERAEVIQQKQQVATKRKEATALFSKLHEKLRKKETEVLQILTKNMEDLEAIELKCNKLLEEMSELLDYQHNHAEISLREATEMWNEIQLAKQLIAAALESKALPPLSIDVCVEPAMQSTVASLIEMLRDLKIKCTDFKIARSQERLLTIRGSGSKDFKPVQACLWTKTKGHGIRGHVDQFDGEVLLVTNRQQLCVLSLEGEKLGCLLIGGDAKIHVDWFSMCPSQERLAVACRLDRVALVCDMSGREKHRIRCPGSLSTVCLDHDQLIVTDAGVMENGPPRAGSTVPGSVTIYSGEDFQITRRIPTPATTSFDIYPTAAVTVRGSYFVLTSNESTEDSQPSILEFNNELQSVNEFTIWDTRCPGHMCADAAGRIYVSDHPTGVVNVFSPQGRPIGSVGNFGAKSCHGLSVDSDRLRLVVCDTEGGRVFVVPLRTVEA